MTLVSLFNKTFQTHADKVAIEFNDKTVTFGEINKSANKVANALRDLSVKKGDRVALFLSNSLELIYFFIGILKNGSVVVPMNTFFKERETSHILNNSGAKVILTDKERLPTIKKILPGLEGSKHIITVDSNDLTSYNELIDSASDEDPNIELNGQDGSIMFYTSGTTGKPKGVIHDTGGYAIQAYQTCKWNFNLNRGDVMWCTADVGWITGHTYAFYGPLLVGATTLIYEGGPDYPNLGRWWKIIKENKVNVFYTAPTAIRMFMKQGDKWLKKYNLKSLKILGSVGEPIDIDSWNWYFKNIGKSRCPIMDTWWQTETGGIMISPIPFVTPTIPTFATLPFPGIQPCLMDETGEEIKGSASVFSPNSVLSHADSSFLNCETPVTSKNNCQFFSLFIGASFMCESGG